MWLFLISALLFIPGIPADSFDTGKLIEKLSEEGKLPENAGWSEEFMDAFAAETGEAPRMHPLALSVIAGSVTAFTGGEDPAAAAALMAEAMRTADRQLRRGVPRPHIRQEARRSLRNIREQSAAGPPEKADTVREWRGPGRERARTILETLDNPGRAKIPFSGAADIPGQGPPSVPEKRETPGDSGNPGNNQPQGPPF